mmetsp:Transcript_1307/g.2164  ORF Transcript_1307/g.2164 Transcript_1307/m.2164 type:complete len:435 (-) Transcript_1307:519-1823(-)
MNTLALLSCVCLLVNPRVSTAFAPASKLSARDVRSQVSFPDRIRYAGESQLWSANEAVNGDILISGLDTKETPSSNNITDEIIAATNDGPSAATKQPQSTESLPQSQAEEETKPSFPLVLWRFSRPHTLIGSALAIPSISLLAAPTYKVFFTTRTLVALTYAAVPSLLMNLYITGLNQITDVEIDKINKPYLPIAKGDLKKSTAIGVVLAAVVVSLIMSVCNPVLSTSGLQVALWGSFVLGTVYSLPPFRLKRHPLLAAFCIVAVRGTIINAGFYSHALSAAFSSTKEAAAGFGVLHCLLNDWKCAFSSLFFGVFGIVIALMKDVPDADGDRIFDIKSFTVRIGQKRVFRTMKNLLVALFGVSGGALMKWATMSPTLGATTRRGLTGLGCLLAGYFTYKEAKDVNPEDSGEVYDYYMQLWKLFYLSYLALPLVK